MSKFRLSLRIAAAFSGVALVLLLCIGRANAAQGDITTVAGGSVGDGNLATNSRINRPSSVCVDGTGNIYIADTQHNRVRKVDAKTGIISTVAGDGTAGFAGDGGPATSAKLWVPYGVFVDGSDNLYISEGSTRVRKIDARTGIISTVAGSGQWGFSGDNGPATSARLADPYDVCMDGAGNIYIADYSNQRVRKVDAKTGVISTVAGNGTAGFEGDGGPATSAKLSNPFGIFVDGAGNLYISDNRNQRVRKVDAKTGIISTVAGDGTAGFAGDGGPATSAKLNGPQGLFVDGSGNLYIADRSNSRVRKVDAKTGIISTVAGMGSRFFPPANGGPVAEARLSFVTDVFMDVAGNLYISEEGGHRILKVDAKTEIISMVVGGHVGDGGPATSASLIEPIGFFVDDAGNLFISEWARHTIRKVDGSGMISTVAGNGVRDFAGDSNKATLANLTAPFCVVVDNEGNFYISDTGNNRIRKVDSKGIITTVVGGGEGSGDGVHATKAKLSTPRGIFIDASGNLFISEQGAHRVRRVDAKTGIITTVAGNGKNGYSGDGGTATEASLNSPMFIFVDGSGNIYIADYSNQRVRKVDGKTGIISTVAGDGTAGFAGDGGAATSAKLRIPSGVFLDGSGNIYIADQGNHRIRKVDGGTGIISTIAGTGTGGFSGDGGPATSASLSYPWGLFVDRSGNLFTSEYMGARIRKVENIAAPITLKIGVFAPAPPPPPPVFSVAAKRRAVVVATVTRGGAPAAGVEVGFSRSTSGQARDYKWKGTTDAMGSVRVEIVADAPQFWMTGASGYYLARATDASGAVIGTWTSIPINGGNETTLTLPIGGQASIVSVRALEPSGSLSLHANYPNPFNPATQIAYELPEPAEVRLAIYNALGQEVRALVQGRQEAGYYRVTWDGRDAAGRQVSSGLYFYRLMGSGFSETRKMLLLK